MITFDSSRKVTATHLRRNAYLYIRQSTLKQVVENTESTQRQYALRDRAIALGWPNENVKTIDRDLGISGAIADGREGFKTLVSEVGLGNAGIVMGLEVSRLARNSTEWHRLVEICALTDTLILDEDGIYDPSQFNDRLLLGLKGTMSEAELYVLRARLRGGILNKASRGELGMKLPIGLVYDLNNKVCLDPDSQIQEAVRLLFEIFTKTASAFATVRFFNKHGLKFPRRTIIGGNIGDVVWKALTHDRVLKVLHNPRYSGAFTYGRSTYRKDIKGKVRITKKTACEWTFLIKEFHPGYITWDQYERNLKQLSDNSEAHGLQRSKGPPREGCALIQGMIVCGRCGRRMTVRYNLRGRVSVPTYVCQSECIQAATAPCQVIPGGSIDEAIGDLLIETVSKHNIESSLRVHDEIKRRLTETSLLRRKNVERAKYEADLSQRRYMQVDPANRLVADSLEADWNNKIRELHEAQELFERLSREDAKKLSDENKSEIISIVDSFPKLWKDSKTTNKDRKRMTRLLIEDVTIIRENQILVNIRFRAGATKEIALPLPKKNYEIWTTPEQIINDISKLLDTHTDEEIADHFNLKAIQTGKGHRFTSKRVNRIRQIYKLSSRMDRLRNNGWLTRTELAQKLGVGGQTLLRWAKAGRIETKIYKNKTRLYADPGENPPKPMSYQDRGRQRYAKFKSRTVLNQ